MNKELLFNDEDTKGIPYEYPCIMGYYDYEFIYLTDFEI